MATGTSTMLDNKIAGAWIMSVVPSLSSQQPQFSESISSPFFQDDYCDNDDDTYRPIRPNPLIPILIDMVL
jgi:hypothetical protein